MADALKAEEEKAQAEAAKKAEEEEARGNFRSDSPGHVEPPLSLFSLLLEGCANGTRPVKCISFPLLVFTLSSRAEAALRSGRLGERRKWSKTSADNKKHQECWLMSRASFP